MHVTSLYVRIDSVLKYIACCWAEKGMLRQLVAIKTVSAGIKSGRMHL